MIKKFNPKNETHDFNGMRVERVPFTMISNRVISGLASNGLSLAIYVYMQSKPPTWEIRKKDIMNSFQIGETLYQKSMGILKKSKLIDYVQMRNKDGSFGRNEILVKDGLDFIQCSNLEVHLQEAPMNPTGHREKNEISAKDGLNFIQCSDLENYSQGTSMNSTGHREKGARENRVYRDVHRTPRKPVPGETPPLLNMDLNIKQKTNMDMDMDMDPSMDMDLSNTAVDQKQSAQPPQSQTIGLKSKSTVNEDEEYAKNIIAKRFSSNGFQLSALNGRLKLLRGSPAKQMALANRIASLMDNLCGTDVSMQNFIDHVDEVMISIENVH